MRDENQEKLAALMALSANFGKEFSTALLKIWLELLEEYPARVVTVGVRRVIAQYEYKTIPPFAVLRKAIESAAGIIPQEESMDIAAAAEWNKLVDDIGRRGRYNCPQFCPTTAYALRGMGGWDAACSWETDKLEWRRREFIEAWKQAHGREEAMSLGEGGVMSLTSGGPESARSILGRVLEIRQ
ncbi:hypothetical protein [uncultured Desulfovibrio sp.]|uniref:hypothetical protein n=1 Tax=uncultured Desulfovibrio sp. TaxID=167968 RepID=UPI00260A4E86|nr:hypothetical protein [uncultured Desulfovibrio sp.]